MRIHRFSLVLAVLLVAGLATSAAAQVRNREGESGSSSGSTAAPRPSPAPAPAPSPAPAPAPTASQPVSSTAPAAQPRREPRGGSTTSSTGSNQSGGAVTRPRAGRPITGVAVPRGSVQSPTVTVVPLGYYSGLWPWGYGGLGFSTYYLYDPFYGGYGYGYGYVPYSSVSSGLLDGAIRLKIKPRNAQVYADGYYVGVVDDFDGVFQRLHLEAGPHHIEVREDGFEPLAFDVQIQLDHTIKYEGEMRKTQ
jgi:hypothetical protein